MKRPCHSPISLRQSKRMASGDLSMAKASSSSNPDLKTHFFLVMVPQRLRRMESGDSLIAQGNTSFNLNMRAREFFARVWPPSVGKANGALSVKTGKWSSPRSSIRFTFSQKTDQAHKSMDYGGTLIGQAHLPSPLNTQKPSPFRKALRP